MERTALIQHIENHHPLLVSKTVCALEELPNMTNRNVCDTGLWFSESEHLTVIFTSVGDSLESSSFSVMVMGNSLRALVSNKKYNSCHSLEKLDKLLSKFV